MAPSLASFHSKSPVNPPFSPEGAGCRLSTLDGRELPLVSAALRVEAAGGIARVVLEQCFENPYAEPLSVTYRMPLPADGAVSGYAFTVGSRRITGEVDRKEDARERFERAILAGHTAALLEQERSSVFTQEIGNIPPGAALTAEISVDQKLVFLDEGSWEWRFPTVVAPRYLGAAGRVKDAAQVTVGVSPEPLTVRALLELSIGDAVPQGKKPESPSHPIAARFTREGTSVSLTDAEGARLDRDVVVRWPVARPEVGLSLQTARSSSSRLGDRSAYGLLTIVPPSPDHRGKAVARDLIVLVDTSGSMGGRPLEQAARVVSALIDSLTAEDRIELISFSSAPRRWKSDPVNATPAIRREAIAWVTALRAGGSTEMHTALFEALRPLRAGAQRQVILVTDGQIGFEREILETVHERLPRGSRLHTLGVGSAVNRSLTGPAARAGRGVEVVLGLDEDPERGARRMSDRTFAPLVTDVIIEGDAVLACVPAAMPDLFAASPVLVSLELRPEGGSLRVRGQTANGDWSETIEVPPTAARAGNQALVALLGREAVEDLEARWAMGDGQKRLDEQIAALGVRYQIATRLTSWVAISEEITVDPRGPSRHEDMPQEIPYGTSLASFGLRAPSAEKGSGDELFSIQAPESAPHERSMINLKARLGKTAMSSPAESPFSPGIPLPPLAGPAPGAAPPSRSAQETMLSGASRQDRLHAAPSSFPASRRARRGWLVLLLLLLVAIGLAYYFLAGPGAHASTAPAHRAREATAVVSACHPFPPRQPSSRPT